MPRPWSIEMKWSKKYVIMLVLILLATSFIIGVITSTHFFGTTGSLNLQRFEGLMAPKLEAAKTITTAPTVVNLADRAEAEGSQLPQQIKYVNRMIIRTANINMEAEDPEKVVNEIMLIADSLGGYVESMGVHENERISANIVVRVPEKSFFEALTRIRGLGKVLREEISGKDVTEQYIDLEARLRNLKAEEEWLLKAMDKAKNVQELMVVERELWRIRGEIERIEGQLKYLERRVEYSTIMVYITQLGKPRPTPSPYPSFDITPALAAAITAIYYIIYGLTFLVIAGAPVAVLVYAGYRVYRRFVAR
ncbi:MAG TPA: DUF4349 domain-containing protein [Nitrososphaeria archaeon]|nr:DUF4349 domain-containing protein [Nitrososphaeria archaeon]